VASGRVYETEGGQGIGMHEAAAVRPLIPVAKSGSLRFFRNDHQPSVFSGYDEEEPAYFYGNVNALIGPSQFVAVPPTGAEIGFEGYVAAIVLGDAHRLELDEADGVVLGYTILTVLVDRTAERAERSRNGGFGRSYDLAVAMGPVLTTPEELDDFLEDSEFGRQYRLQAVGRVNGVEVARGNLADLPITFAQAITTASQTCPLREGDVFALGPIATSDDPVVLKDGDEVQVAVENLGTLSLKVSA